MKWVWSKFCWILRVIFVRLLKRFKKDPSIWMGAIKVVNESEKYEPISSMDFLVALPKKLRKRFLNLLTWENIIEYFDMTDSCEVKIILAVELFNRSDVPLRVLFDAYNNTPKVRDEVVKKAKKFRKRMKGVPVLGLFYEAGLKVKTD